MRLADCLTRDLPNTLAALAAGDISERRARIIADETDCLSAEDGMARFTAVLGAEHCAAIMSALRDEAAIRKAAGDERRPGQLKADILTERVTGTSPTEATPVTVNLVVGTETLFGDGREPGYIPGVGHLPAALCRDLVARACAEGKAALRRLFVTPRDRELVAMRQPHPSAQSRRPPCRGWAHQCRQRPGAVPDLQPGQGGARLDPLGRFGVPTTDRVPHTTRGPPPHASTAHAGRSEGCAPSQPR